MFMEATPNRSTIVVRTHELCGTVVQQRETDGYINATQLCKAAGREFYNYQRTQHGNDYIEALSLKPNLIGLELVQVKSGKPENGGGTWVHPKVAIHLAQWLSPEFALQVTDWVIELMTKGHVSVTPAQPRHWYDRIRETWNPHSRYVRKRFPGMFTVASELAVQIMTMEDMLHLHNMCTNKEDRPDISIGLRWSRRRDELGWHEARFEAPLRLNEQNTEVMVKVYPHIELKEFHKWFCGIYMPSNFIAYLDNKREFKPYESLVRASAADHACLEVAEEHARLDTVRRDKLTEVGGFYKSPHVTPVAPKQPKRITKRSPRGGKR